MSMDAYQGDCGIHVGLGEGNLCMHITEVFS